MSWNQEIGNDNFPIPGVLWEGTVLTELRIFPSFFSFSALRWLFLSCPEFHSFIVINKSYLINLFSSLWILVFSLLLHGLVRRVSAVSVTYLSPLFSMSAFNILYNPNPIISTYLLSSSTEFLIPLWYRLWYRRRQYFNKSDKVCFDFTLFL